MNLILLRTCVIVGWVLITYACAAQAQSPNIIFVVADDLGYGELGSFGGTEIPTPHLDALASGGVRFTNAYVTAPFCAASRAALMTARYQSRFGFEHNPVGAKNAEAGVGLPVTEATIAEQLRSAGYATALVGKWHLGGTAPFHPYRRGFDEFFGFLHEGHYFVPPPWSEVTTWLRRKSLPDKSSGRWTSSNGRVIWSTHMGHREPDYDADNPLLRGSQPVDEHEHLTDAFTREACDFIERHTAQPFFLCLAYNAVHSPMQAADRTMQRFSHIEDDHRRIFAAMLGQLDDSIGRLVTKLRETGIEERTLVVFLSDNGGPTKELTSSNLPLRGGKGDLWEGGIRVPLILSWIGTLPAGRVEHVPVSSMDVSATALAVGGCATPPHPLDGENLLPLLKGETTTAPHTSLCWRLGKKQAVRSGHWKLVRDQPGPWQLYNLEQDLSETVNLARQQTERTAELARVWDAWNSEQFQSPGKE